MLDAGFGAGKLHVHDPDCTCKGKKNRCENRVHLPGAHEAVIGPEEWIAYLARRELVSATAPRARQGLYPVTGLARCGHCRGAIVSGGKVNGDGAEAALALREEHTRVLGDLERARAAAAAGPSADSMALLPDLLGQWDILPASALNAILRTVVRRVAVYRQSPRRQGPGGRWVPAENRFEVLPVWEDDPWEGKMPQRGQRTRI